MSGCQVLERARDKVEGRGCGYVKVAGGIPVQKLFCILTMVVVKGIYACNKTA